MFNPSKPKTNLPIFKDPAPYCAVNTLRLGYKTSQLMLYREIIAVCSQIHTKKGKYTVWAERRIIYEDPVRTAQ
jgi:hypothetical protein